MAAQVAHGTKVVFMKTLTYQSQLRKFTIVAWAARSWIGIALAAFSLHGCDWSAPKRINKPTASPASATAPAANPTVAAAEQVDATESAEPGGQSPDIKLAPEWEPTGTWTTRRLIALVETGPCLIDLFVSVDGKTLELAAQEQQTRLAQELFDELERPASWEELLNLPLVRSGWLGNLIPDENQREQVISLYDTLRDGMVQDEELPAFLSRGLARSGPLQLSDRGYAADHDPSQSPWGIGDANQDFSLNLMEKKQFLAALEQLDLNADAILSRTELLGEPGQTSMSMGNNVRSSMLRAVTLMSAEPTQASDQAGESSKHARKLASDLLRHYTFLAEVSREQWANWTEEQWNGLDKNQNQQLDTFELQKIVECPAHLELYIAFPTISSAADEASTELRHPLHVRLLDSAFTWHENATGGHLAGRNCSLRIELQDNFSQEGKQQLRQQLTQALANEQVQAFLTQRWQLGTTAFELVDTDQDEKLSEQELDRVWQWLASRQGSRLLAQWMLSSQPWIQLADTNADLRLSQLELQAFVADVQQLDRNGDDLLTPNEVPLVATLELKRSDSRFEFAFPGSGTMAQPTMDGDWFSAMDTNRDGAISRAEFLGETTDFVDWDQDQDGFLSRGEVYFPKASK
jgi:Ca2+-binding EF-hand superfamily protein